MGLSAIEGKFLLVIAFIFAICSSTYSQKSVIAPGNSVFIEQLTTVELASKIKDGYTTVLIYSGGTEETGPQMVLGKHNFRVASYALRVAEGLGKTLVAPILPFAPNHVSLQKFPGTISLDVATFSAVNEQVAISLITSGFKHIIFMSDHFDSQYPLQQLAKKLSTVYKDQDIDVYLANDGYAKARKQIEASVQALGIVPGGHGGYWDVSETMAISPAFVRPAYFQPGDTTFKGNGPIDARGVSGDPRKANAASGKEFADLRIELYIAEIRNHISAFK